MRNERLPHGLHPDWCDLGDDCADATRDPRHRGMASAMWPIADGSRIDVELVRSDDKIPAFTIEGEQRIVLRLTNMESCNIDGSPLTADTYLSARDALALAHALESYATRLERRTNNFTPETIRNEKSCSTTSQ